MTGVLANGSLHRFYVSLLLDPFYGLTPAFMSARH